MIDLGFEESDLMVVFDGRDSSRQCAYIGCNEIAVEYNHWGPRYLFPDDYENWPGDYLCPEHHLLWHRIVTPDMWKVKNGLV